MFGANFFGQPFFGQGAALSTTLEFRAPHIIVHSPTRDTVVVREGGTMIGVHGRSSRRIIVREGSHDH